MSLALARDKVGHHLREAILRGRRGFRPGDILSEAGLTEMEFGDDAKEKFGKGPIRDALAELDNQGLVRVLPRAGTQVRMVSASEATMILGARIQLESYVVYELALRAHRLGSAFEFGAAMKAQSRMEALATRYQEAASQGQRSEILEDICNDFTLADCDFHYELACLLPNAKVVLADQIRNYFGQIILYALANQMNDGSAIPTAVRQKDVLRDHDLLLRTIRSGQPTEASTLYHAQMKKTAARIVPQALGQVDNAVNLFGVSSNQTSKAQSTTPSKTPKKTAATTS